MAETNTKRKLMISPCTINTDGTVSIKGEKFEVMLNPGSYKHVQSICYNKTKAIGDVGQEAKFFARGNDKVSFDIVIDGTGVVDAPFDVKTQVMQLNSIIYKYDGINHQPNPVRLLWGTLIFFGRLESITHDYTLFKPTGEPLRAKIALSFTGFMSKEEQALKANKSSPDLTHIIQVKSGDTLPLLCYKIYKDSSYYLEVARINNMTSFRDIKPGTALSFPPLR